MRRIAPLARRRLGRAVAAALLLAAGPAAAQTITWQMANEYPATSIHGEGDQFFARELWERSGGRIVITHSFDASLGYRSKDLLQAVARGTVVLGDMYVGALGDMLLYPSPWPPAGIWARKPVTSMEALRGLRIRTPDGNGTATFLAGRASGCGST
jgi:TRAP-type transport system periplasmic protein